MAFLAVAGALSVLTVPEEGFHEPGALVLPGILLSLAVLGGPLLSVARKPFAITSAENILCFGVFYWLVLEMLQGQRYLPVPRAAIIGSILLILAFAAAIWVGSALVSPRTRSQPEPPDIGIRFLAAIALVAGAAGASRYLIACQFSPGCLVDSFQNSRFGAPWRRINAFGPFDTLFVYVRYLAHMSIPLTTALVLKQGRLTRIGAVSALLATFCLVMMVRDGGRKDIGTVIGASALVWYLLRPRLSFRRVAVTGVLLMGLVYLMQFMLVARTLGFAAALSGGGLNRSGHALGTVDRNFEFLAHILELVPARVGFDGWNGVAYAVFTFIPAKLAPPRGLDLPGYLGLQVGAGYTWTCSAIGDLYLIAGVPAVLAGGVLLGLAAARLRRGLPPTNLRNILLYALGTMTLFLTLRALHEFFVTGMIVALFALMLAARRAPLRTAPRRLALGRPGADSRDFKRQ